MKVLVLEQTAKERALIEQVLQAGRHELLFAENAAQAWSAIQAREARFVIADAEASDVIASDLVRSVRAAPIPPVYFLLLSSHEKLQSEADDILRKPFRSVELQTRMAIGQRILSLGDSLSQARDQLENSAMYDPLTGMMNQTAFSKQAQNELDRARRADSTLSLIALDVDNFQAINERYGPEAGNKTLRIVADHIRERSRTYDCVGRWTGPKFMIALLNVNGPAAESIARRIVTGVRFLRIIHAGETLELSISAGVSTANNITESTELEALIEQAEQALERAKGSGGYQVLLAKA